MALYGKLTGQGIQDILIISKYLRMEIKQNFNNLNSFVHLQSTSAFFPKFYLHL